LRTRLAFSCSQAAERAG